MAQGLIVLGIAQAQARRRPFLEDFTEYNVKGTGKGIEISQKNMAVITTY